ncbi:MAG TPA: 50S ribosomal protein L3 [Gemmataceae bacterium]|nr:50S ribosomal protein L3 [Gemmataceae bacterium]
MALGLLGLKIGMTQVFDDKGKSAPVTVLQIGPCPVLQVRTQEIDGYDAVQLGFMDKPRNKATLPERGHVANKIETKRRQYLVAAGVQIPEKADCEPQRYIREFRLEKPSEIKVGALLTAAEVFGEIPRVDVIGTSKGRGTTGSMKRHGFGGLPASHGVKKHHRSPGSIGSHASNRGSGRPKKGHKAAGRHGNSRVTSRNLDVVKIDSENNLILVRGAVPGPNGGLVMIRPTNKRQKPGEAAPKAEAKKK